MFTTSSQRKYWMFHSQKELDQLRIEANHRFIKIHGASGEKKQFLTPAEERMLYKQYEYLMRDFCRKFQPPMPRSVIGTAFHYMKRYYLNNSVMDFHPKQIMVTCVYLACKVEEFNVSMAQFVDNIKGNREKAADIILHNELLLMQQLKYHLTVQNPFRCVEGFLIDLKTRCLTAGDPERYRHEIDDFMDKIFFSDAVLLYSPSQIALAAIIHAGRKHGGNIESYVMDILCGEDDEKQGHVLLEKISEIESLVSKIEPVNKEQWKAIEKKLEKCRNEANNPDSTQYKRRIGEGGDEPPSTSGGSAASGHQGSKPKYAKLSQDPKSRESDATKRSSNHSKSSSSDHHRR